jgi:16S rRNA (guanine527-N7)-methyltransferase
MTNEFRHIRGPEDFTAAFDVSRETIDRLKAYEALVRQWQKHINLVGPATLDDMWHRHFADSAQLLALAPAARTWVDLGTGAGFPGLVVAILMAEAERRAASPSPRLRGKGRGEGRREAVGSLGTAPRVTLIESNARRCAFLREVVRQTGLSAPSQSGIAVDILSIRSENAATQASLQAPEIVSARALAPLDRLLELAATLFASHTVGLFLKGRGAAREVEAAQRTWEFRAELVQSRTERDGRIVIVRHLEPKNGGKKP